MMSCPSWYIMKRGERDLIAGTVDFDHVGEVLSARSLHWEVTIFFFDINDRV